jgi:hypothetical protein
MLNALKRQRDPGRGRSGRPVLLLVHQIMGSSTRDTYNWEYAALGLLARLGADAGEVGARLGRLVGYWLVSVYTL